MRFILHPSAFILTLPSFRLHPSAFILHPFFLLLLALLPACSSSRSYRPYSPHENILSIAAEFQLLAPRDPYRQPIGRDLTGQSIARATLLRVANYQSLHPDRFVPEVQTLRARSLELLGDYRSAQRNYTEAAEYDTELRDDNLRRARTLALMVAVIEAPPKGNTLVELIEQLNEQAVDLRRVGADSGDEFYRLLCEREAEEAEVRRAELLAANRYAFPDGDMQALRALEFLVQSHRESSRGLEHALRLARYHRELAEEELRLNPPTGTRFSQERFQRHYDACVDLLYRISQADGSEERLVARFELDAMLALGENVQKKLR